MFSEIKSHEIIYRSVHKLMYGPSIVKQKSHIINQSKQLQTVPAEIRKKKMNINIRSVVYLWHKIFLPGGLYFDLMLNLHRSVCRLGQSRIAAGRTDPYVVDNIVVEFVIRQTVAVTGHFA